MQMQRSACGSNIIKTHRGNGVKFLFIRCKRGVNKDILLKHASLQAIDAGMLYGAGHAEAALREAQKAFENRENLSKDLYVEIIVRASGQRHIKKAFEMFGLKNSREILVIGKNSREIEKLIKEAEGREFEVKMDKRRVETLKKGFEISENELSASPLENEEEAVKAVINERIALISIL